MDFIELKNSDKENFDLPNLKPHPKIPFVYYNKDKLICVKHLKGNGMNKGAMRQHVEGKQHKINFDTGEPIPDSDFPKEIFSKIKPEEKIQDKQSNSMEFWELNNQLKIMFPDSPDIRRVILAQHAYEGDIGENIKFWMKYEGIKKFQENNPNRKNIQNDWHN